MIFLLTRNCNFCTTHTHTPTITAVYKLHSFSHCFALSIRGVCICWWRGNSGGLAWFTPIHLMNKIKMLKRKNGDILRKHFVSIICIWTDVLLKKEKKKKTKNKNRKAYLDVYDGKWVRAHFRLIGCCFIACILSSVTWVFQNGKQQSVGIFDIMAYTNTHTLHAVGVINRCHHIQYCGGLMKWILGARYF